MINKLLNCSEGEEWQLLEEHPELLDVHFIQLMQKVAEELEQKGDEEGADFLIDLARQLAKLLGISGNVAADNPSPTATPDKYFNFLMQVLQATSDSEGDPDVVYPLLERNLDKLDEFLARVLQAWGNETLAKVESEEANYIAADIVRFSNLIAQYPLSNRLSKLEIAVTGYELALTVYTREALPLDWADTKNGLGNAYCDRIKGDRGENIDIAIACYQDALQVLPVKKEKNS